MRSVYFFNLFKCQIKSYLFFTFMLFSLVSLEFTHLSVAASLNEEPSNSGDPNDTPSPRSVTSPTLSSCEEICPIVVENPGNDWDVLFSDGKEPESKCSSPGQVGAHCVAY